MSAALRPMMAPVGRRGRRSGQRGCGHNTIRPCATRAWLKSRTHEADDRPALTRLRDAPEPRPHAVPERPRCRRRLVSSPRPLQQRICHPVDRRKVLICVLALKRVSASEPAHTIAPHRDKRRTPSALLAHRLADAFTRAPTPVRSRRRRVEAKVALDGDDRRAASGRLKGREPPRALGRGGLSRL